MKLNLKAVLLSTALLTLMPAAAIAQEDLADRANKLAEQAADVQEEAGDLANDVIEAENQEAVALEDQETLTTDDGRADNDGDSDGNWGLLGLLGLAGLLGLRGATRAPHLNERRDPPPRV